MMILCENIGFSFLRDLMRLAGAGFCGTAPCGSWTGGADRLEAQRPNQEEDGRGALVWKRLDGDGQRRRAVKRSGRNRLRGE